MRLVRWYEKNSDRLLGESPLKNIDLFKLKELFCLHDDNPMYDCYPIDTIEQVKYIEESTKLSINLDIYDYFIELDSSTLIALPELKSIIKEFKHTFNASDQWDSDFTL